MANQITTLQDAQKFSTALFLAKDICSDVGFSQVGESKLVFDFVMEQSRMRALFQLTGFEIKILGKKDWKFLSKEFKDCLHIQVVLEIAEDWELEHDIHAIFKEHGYVQPTDLVFKKLA